MLQRLKKILHYVVRYGSGEFLLDHMPNGGTAVLARSLLVTFIVCALTAPLKSYLVEGTVFLSFSWEQAKQELGEMIPWFGAIFAGVYAALYSRFAAQWAYLAGLYNQFMASCTAMTYEQRRSNDSLSTWHAGFIEDAIELHLAAKPMFASIIASLLQDGEVVRAFVDGTANGAEKLAQLEKTLGISAVLPANSEARSSACLTRMAAEGQRAPA